MVVESGVIGRGDDGIGEVGRGEEGSGDVGREEAGMGGTGGLGTFGSSNTTDGRESSTILGSRSSVPPQILSTAFVTSS